MKLKRFNIFFGCVILLFSIARIIIGTSYIMDTLGNEMGIIDITTRLSYERMIVLKQLGIVLAIVSIMMIFINFKVHPELVLIYAKVVVAGVIDFFNIPLMELLIFVILITAGIEMTIISANGEVEEEEIKEKIEEDKDSNKGDVK